MRSKPTAGAPAAQEGLKASRTDILPMLPHRVPPTPLTSRKPASQAPSTSVPTTAGSTAEPGQLPSGFTRVPPRTRQACLLPFCRRGPSPWPRQLPGSPGCSGDAQTQPSHDPLHRLLMTATWGQGSPEPQPSSRRHWGPLSAWKAQRPLRPECGAGLPPHQLDSFKVGKWPGSVLGARGVDKRYHLPQGLRSQSFSAMGIKTWVKKQEATETRPPRVASPRFISHRQNLGEIHLDEG